MLYMHLAPQALPAYAGTRPAGCVVYNGSKIDIPPEAVDQKFIEAFEYFLDVIAGSEPAWKVPSCHECRFCDIARTECPERSRASGLLPSGQPAHDSESGKERETVVAPMQDSRPLPPEQRSAV